MNMLSPKLAVPDRDDAGQCASLPGAMPIKIDIVTSQSLPHYRDALDRFVHQHKASTPFHTSAWGLAVEQGTGQFWFCIMARTDDGIAGVLPAHIIHSPLFGRACVSTGFAVDGGVLARDAHVAAALHQEFWALAQRYSCPTAELRGGWLPDSNGWHQISDRHAGFIADLAHDDDSQLLAIPRKQRAEVRKGLKNNLVVTVGRDQAICDVHYAVYAESVRNLGTPVFPKTLFDAVIRHFESNADILLVSDGQKPLAAVLSIYHDDMVMPYWGGGVWNARATRANDVMYYALMNHARQRGCKRFDFGRSKIGTGAYNFKKNWGFAPEALTYCVRTADGAQPRDINPLNPKYQARIKLWQKLPLSIANRLGPVIAKGLG